MRIKFIPLLVIIMAISLTFAIRHDAPRSTVYRLPQDDVSILSLDESTLDPQKVALLERLTLTLDSPSMIRLGDVAVFRLTVTIDEREPASIETDAPSLSIIPDMVDVFDFYNLIAEARLELPRIFVTPSNIVSQPIRAGQNITFTWSVPANTEGDYDGTAWFFLRLIPKDGDEKISGEDSSDNLAAQAGSSKDVGTQLPVAAIPLRVRVISLWGLNGTTARLFGIVGLLIGFLLSLPLLLDRLYRVRRSPSL